MPDDNFLLQLLQQSGGGGQPELPSWVKTSFDQTGGSVQPQNTMLSSAQAPPPPPAPAYSPGQNLDGIDLSTGNYQRITQPPPSKLKSMLMGFMGGMGEAMRAHSGMGNDTQRAQGFTQANENVARTGLLNEQQAQMGQMVTLPNGIQMPYSIAVKAFPAMIGAQSRETVADKNNATKKEITQTTRDSIETLANNKPAPATKVDPIILANLGPMPDPVKEPGKAKLWAVEAEKIKTRMAVAPRVAGYNALNAGRYQQVYDPDTDSYGFAPAGLAAAKGLAPAGMAFKNMPKIAQFDEMKTASTKLRGTIQDLDVDFTPEQRAKLQMALSAPSQSLLDNQIQSMLGSEQLTEKQQDFVIWSKQMNERLLSLRNVAGMGQGAEDMRRAIQDTLPNIKSKDKAYAIKQMDAVDQQIQSLYRGIGGKNQMPGGDAGATRQYNGHTYKQEKPGMPWKLVK